MYNVVVNHFDKLMGPQRQNSKCAALTYSLCHNSMCQEILLIHSSNRADAYIQSCICIETPMVSKFVTIQKMFHM